MYTPDQYFTEEEIVQLRRLGVSIRNNIIPLQYKDFFHFKTGQIWDIDTYSAEACLCLSLGEFGYRRHFELIEFNENTVGFALLKKVCYEFKIQAFLKLKESAGWSDNIIICEAGRGVDVLLAKFVKNWKHMIAYDLDKSVLFEINKYFRGELGLPLETKQIHTEMYPFASINEKTIIFATCHNVSENKRQEILDNPNLIGILDGEILTT